MENQPSATQGSFRDSIVTLPGWGIKLISLLLACALALALWLLFLAPANAINLQALQLITLVVPLGAGVITAVAMRRTSTRQIDLLIRSFLDQMLLERFQVWCESANNPAPEYIKFPFAAVKPLHHTNCTNNQRSYAYYQFHWKDFPDIAQLVGFKTNVFNFEILTELKLKHTLTGADAHPAQPEKILLKAGDSTDEHWSKISSHPVLSRFSNVIQGSLNEGYEIKIELLPDARPDATRMLISLRHRFSENFLGSPFLKRYLAEDAAIVIGVLCQEWQNSGLMCPSLLERNHGNGA